MPDSVAPLIQTTWYQKKYYNDLCPENPNGYNGHVLTGCEATAMAQIIRYWGYPLHGRGTHSYTTDVTEGEQYGPLSVNYDSATYNYNLMPRILTDSTPEQEVFEVAQLIYHCGVGVNMNYSCSGSSAFGLDARAALVNYFGYSPRSHMDYQYYVASTAWDSLLRVELAAGRPVLYEGVSDKGGHAFICDGYRPEGYFHFNFGWNGDWDGWFLTSSIDARPGDSFNSNQAALFGLEPASLNNVFYGQMKGLSRFTIDQPVTFCNITAPYNPSGVNYTNPCLSLFFFSDADTSRHLVMDVLDYQKQTVVVYDSETATDYTSVISEERQSFSSVVSQQNTLGLLYQGSFARNGFEIRISPEDSCRMVSQLQAQIQDTTILLTWHENGTATEWQVEYGSHGFNRGEGTLVTTTDTSFIVNELERYSAYDFYVRPLCSDLWTSLKNQQTRERYWHEIISERPEGFQVDTNEVVTISSAEGMAWWNLENQKGNYILSPVHITADIDLSAHLWKPITYHLANLDGHGHTISGLRIVEGGNTSGFTDYGFITYPGSWYANGNVDEPDTIQNLTFLNPEVITLGGEAWTSFPGTFATSAFLGFPIGLVVKNCGVQNGYIDQRYDYEREVVGMLVGAADYFEIYNCYATGSATTVTGAIGGLVGSLEEGRLIVRNCYSQVDSASLIAQVLDEVEITHCYVADTVTSDTLLTALNAWVSENDNLEGLYQWATDAANVNYGYPVLVPAAVGPITQITDVQGNVPAAQKYFRNGQFYIRRDGHLYDVTGRKAE